MFKYGTYKERPTDPSDREREHNTTEKYIQIPRDDFRLPNKRKKPLVLGTTLESD